MPSKQHEGPPHHSLSQQGPYVSSSSSSHQERNHINNSQNPRTTSSNLQINTTNTKRKSPSSSNNSSNTSSPTASLFSSSGISSGRPVSPHNITSPTTTMNQPLGLIPGISPIHHLHHIYSSKDNTNSDTEDPSYRATTRSVSPSIPIPTSISNNNISPNNSLQNHHQLLNAVTSDHSSNISNVSNNTTSSSSSTNNNNNNTGKSHYANRSTARPPSPLFMNAIHSGGNNPYYQQQQQQPSTYSDPISQSNNGLLNPQQPFQQLTSFPSSSQFPKNNINNPLRGTATTPVPKRSHGRVKGSPLNNHLGHQRSSSFDIHAIMEHYHPPTTSMIGNSIIQHRLFNHRTAIVLTINRFNPTFHLLQHP
ncbi:hypothetical protein C9374_007464 [Naegleria lovaniensis]|uniref:Uncharacterized protein n=1 Tax=Naegleria lovaniensis TaxID=51637 RepID=A0AA88GM57_NAELO|nr:uncharacterized protein C9374_007464 [Naegleria lovaniensis]KAG2379325.1 hypothetical protein C9374_007464 [Naegleria lovaniensis]